MGRQRDQRTITLALKILDHAAYGSRTHSVATVEVMLALTVLLRFVDDPAGLHEFWRMSQGASPHPWLSARQGYYMIAGALRRAGWDAPVD